MEPQEKWLDGIGAAVVVTSMAYAMNSHPAQYPADFDGLTSAFIFGMGNQLVVESCMLGGRIIADAAPPVRRGAVIMGLGLSAVTFAKLPVVEKTLEAAPQAVPFTGKILRTSGMFAENKPLEADEMLFSSWYEAAARVNSPNP